MREDRGPAGSDVLVMKFGGTSVGSSEAIRRTMEIVSSSRREWERIVVVTSAMAGVTNLLLRTAVTAARAAGLREKDFAAEIERVATELKERHLSTAGDLVAHPQTVRQLEAEFQELLDQFVHLCRAIQVLGEATPRAMDAVASLGERLSVRLLSAALNRHGVPSEFIESSRLIVTDSQFQAAHPDLQATTQKCREVLHPIISSGKVPVVTGFLGATAGGIITTLGRGGSDYSAAILGAAIPAREVWIWTDVDGVMTTDPRIVPNARTIPRLTYRELGELAYFGAKVLHPMTIRPVVEAGVGLSIRNTFNPSHPGTRLIRGEDSGGVSGAIKAVTAIRGQKLVTIEGRGMLGVPGVAARAFGAVAATGTNVILISQASSEQSITFAVPSESADQVVMALQDAFASELENRDIDRIWASDDTVIVTVVGKGMRHTPGVAGRIFSVLGENQVNVMAIAQGSSEVSISLVVDAHDLELAVRSIHDLIETQSSPTGH